MKPLTELCEEFIKDTLNALTEAESNTDAFFHPEVASLFLVTNDGQFLHYASSEDVYGLLELPIISSLAEIKGVAVHTTGWAAPLNSNGDVDGAPSQHALRRRVALIASVTNDTMASAMVFEDDQSDIMLDEGNAVGMLADALHEAWGNAVLV